MNERNIFDLTISGLRRKYIRGQSMQHEWYDNIEKVLDEYTNSNIDSTECMLQLSNLGYSSQEIIEEIMHDVVPITGETDT
jgi:hypothetical protein